MACSVVNFSANMFFLKEWGTLMKDESLHKILNKRQTELRQIMLGFNQHEEAIQLFLRQHATLHSVTMADSQTSSLEDEVLDDMPDAQVRRIPSNCEHSVAWCIWHIARIEDIAMNILVADSQQILHQDDWSSQLEIQFRDSGNAMDKEAVVELSRRINIQMLRSYRVAVGRRTREIVQGLGPEALEQKVVPSRLQRVKDEGAVVAAADGVVEYWGKRNVAGLLLMPATRHNLVHLNEALRLKRKR